MKKQLKYGIMMAVAFAVGLPVGFALYHWLTVGPLEDIDLKKFSIPLSSDDVEGLPHFAKVSDALYRGAQPTRAGFEKLKEMGIRTIVNLRVTHSDRDDIEGLGLKYVRISFKPWRPENEDVMKFLEVTADAENHPVFVHCNRGEDRTGTMVAVYRMVGEGWPRDVAVKEMRLFGRNCVWYNLDKFVKKLDVERMKAEFGLGGRRGDADGAGEML
ncbi:MAG: tyrosine-protein phosphatase [Planctomycetia bacterium]|nr:tyrosine-protein phosphatase [Planctomycetia bacterium]